MNEKSVEEVTTSKHTRIYVFLAHKVSDVVKGLDKILTKKTWEVALKKVFH